MKGSHGDAARVWHGLDRALPALREALVGFEEAGREDLAEDLEKLMEKTAFGRSKAERDLEGGREEPQW